MSNPRNSGNPSRPFSHGKRRRAKFELLEPRHLFAGIVINELHYDPDNAAERVEFVELYNASEETVDLSGWRIDKAVDFTFSSGAEIGSGEHLVITQSSVDFAAKFGFAAYGEWELGDKLSNSGERIELLDASDNLIDGFTYELGFPWPTVGDTGASIELVDPNLDNSLGGAWRSSDSVPALVQAGSEWRYRKGISNNPPEDWADIDFNEESDNIAWQSGDAGLGYGDGDDTTLLADMQNSYTSVYFRQDFELAGPVPDTLSLRLYVDDGAIIYINGEEIVRPHVSSGTKNYNSTSGIEHEAVWEDLLLTNLDSILVPGTNTLAVHGLNRQSGSSDFSFDAELSASGTSSTPGAPNSSLVANAAPFLSEVQHSVQQPQAGEAVTITANVADADGVASVVLEYQLVEPGDYIAIDDPRYDTNWTPLPMFDNGTNGDATADDGTYSVTLAGTFQTHRRLVRYRVTATDMLGATGTGPYADDPQPNFAYYVYGQTPDWTGAARPGVTPEVTYSGELLDSVNTYHLITTRQDHEEAQHIPNATTGTYRGSEYLWDGALVYDGVVYDHIRYRARGGVWRYAMGKNMWKFDFNRGHSFFASDDYGHEYEVGWDKLNLGAVIQQRNFWHRGEQGLFESVGFKLFDLSGVESPTTNFVQFRIVESADENGADQYSGDFQGLYLAVEQLDGQFLKQHGLPDGNLYKMENGTGVGGIGGEKNNQGDFPEPIDSSDLIDFKTTYESGAQTPAWWEANFNLESYYSYRSIVEGIHHYDIHAGKNYFYYHNPETDQWQTVPWDLDMTWHNGAFGTGNEPFKSRVLAIPQFEQEYLNRMREIRDLLYNPEQTGAIIDEVVSHIYTAGQPSLVDADRAMWDYNPILTSGYVNSSKAGHGHYYAGGPGVSATGSFAGMIQNVKDYVVSRGNWIDSQVLVNENQIPTTPVISYTGDGEFPANALEFATSGFSDPNGDGFGAMEWRIGEIYNPNTPNYDPTQPWRYEIESVWESGELNAFDDSFEITTASLTPGRTYRTRVRVQDDAGNWSHWSAPIEFVAGDPTQSLSVSELHYHPNNPGLSDESDQEFIELVNTGSESIDLSGVQIADFASTPYVFPGGLSLEPGEYIVVARTPNVFTSIYGSEVNLSPTGYANRNLGNGGDTISLLTAGGAVIQSFTYDDGAPWPTASDGIGPSLEILDPFGDPTDPTNWRASTVDGGTPGVANILSGDFDQDSDVDGTDFLAWQLGYLSEFSTQDLTDWQTNFGSPASSFSESASAIVAPLREEQGEKGLFTGQPQAALLDAAFLLWQTAAVESLADQATDEAIIEIAFETVSNGISLDLLQPLTDATTVPIESSSGGRSIRFSGERDSAFLGIGVSEEELLL